MKLIVYFFPSLYCLSKGEYFECRLCFICGNTTTVLETENIRENQFQFNSLTLFLCSCGMYLTILSLYSLRCCLYKEPQDFDVEDIAARMSRRLADRKHPAASIKGLGNCRRAAECQL